MSTSRRDFVALGSMGLLATAIPASALQTPDSQTPQPGAPPAFGTAPAVGPEVSPSTFAEAEKLVQVEMTPADIAAGREQLAHADGASLRTSRRPAQSRTRIHLAPATQWNPSLPGIATGNPTANNFVRSADSHVPLPSSEDDIAFAPVAQLSRWIENRQLTSDARSPRSTFAASSVSTPSCTASSPSPATTPSRRPARPTPRSPPAIIAARSTASPGAPRTCSTPPAFPPPMALSPSRTASPPKTAQSSSASTPPAPCWSPSSAWAPSRSTTSGLAARP